MKKLLIAILFLTYLTAGMFEIADAVVLGGTGYLVYYAMENSNPNQPFHHRLKEGLQIDGWHVFHLAQGTIYGWMRQQDSVRDWLWWHGTPEWLADPSKNILMLENLTLALTWEGLEYLIDGKNYIEIYGSKENAIKNNVMDVVMSSLGCYATTDLPWLRYLVPWKKYDSFGISIGFTI